ncbi:hypothetical protein H0Z60_03615 [Ectothiorhodospiraceae bacterium WFHF3C12]|nr:hypothetical protein [Ectothiorhodospiraceae bacterium WFHF3C12]
MGVTTGALSPKYFQMDDGVAINAGIGFGLRLPGVHGVSVEALWTGSAVPRPGEEPGPSDNTNNRSSALFAVYRSGGSPYLKARAGVGRQRLYDDDSSRTRTDFAGGLGVGWTVPEGALEIEQSFFNADAWYISLSYFYDLY